MKHLLRVPRLPAASLALLLVVSCSNPVCGCLTPARALLHGRVTNPAGGGVPGAIVLAEEGRAGCDGDFFSVISSTRAAADGSYRLLMRTGGPPPPDACPRAYARPPSLSTLVGSDTAEFTVEFSYDRPIDSARVDLVLREP